MLTPEVLIFRDFCDVMPDDLDRRGIRLLGVDIENLLTDYGCTEVRPEAARKLYELQTACSALQKVVLITNSRDMGSIEAVRLQLDGLSVYYPNNGRRGKMTGELFTEALNISGVEPRLAAHADDQFKTICGLRAARYGLFIWTEPWGDCQHPIVRMLRPAESLVRRAIARRQNKPREATN